MPVLELQRQHYYAWLAAPITAEYEQACLPDAIVDAHREDLESGYRLVFDVVIAASHQVSERTV